MEAPDAFTLILDPARTRSAIIAPLRPRGLMLFAEASLSDLKPAPRSMNTAMPPQAGPPPSLCRFSLVLV
jgi:hypothetical protein